jgi:hypothetical protein
MCFVTAVIFVSLLVGRADLGARPAAETAETRAVAFLSGDVPRWSRENHCYSCHNNGDAARALFAASRAGYQVPADSLADTTRWLIRPAGWDHNGGEGPFSDKRLARVVFTSTLETAVATGWVRDRAALVLAAERLALDQGADGSWPLDGEDALGSPATYGRPLATLAARNSLAATDPARFRTAIDRADAWLSKREIHSINDASVCLMERPATATPAGDDRRKRSLNLLRQGQSDDGGWGAHVNSPPEPFDTALAILALVQGQPSPEGRRMIARGRAFLLARQQDDGGWIETTRPPGNLSYAQRISTTAWATLALLASREFSAAAGSDPKR